MRLIVTRPEDDARPLAARLEAMGHDVILAPLLTIRWCSDMPVPDRAYQAVLITSANGARAIARRHEMARLRSASAFTVGPASAAAASDAGFADVREAEGDIAALCSITRSALRPEAGPLLYVSGAVTAGDLAGELRASGFDVDRVVAYDAVPAEALPTACRAALAVGRADGVLLFSPRTAGIWAKLVANSELSATAAKLVHFCLSDNVAAAVARTLGRGVDLRVPSRPDEAALIDLIGAAV